MTNPYVVYVLEMENGENYVGQTSCLRRRLYMHQRQGSVKKPGLHDIARVAARDAEKAAVKEVLEKTHWNRAESARLLKISYKAMLYKIRQVGLDDRRSGGEGQCPSPPKRIILLRVVKNRARALEVEAEYAEKYCHYVLKAAGTSTIFREHSMN